ncbi:hypothetical protein [Mitsuaria sp. GD03876]|uniref:hypothetical protein n=1 Tax=Mitsuaria sp. GD03876 TaxID=2975399 RepID=UPI002447BFD5|nr:hypothetical protein [Mitsuaria sp. GD03876]MDH0865366.1 hypothetical protein [Mitsuaria sp. GD03876]
MNAPPVVLDFDAAVPPLPAEHRLPFSDEAHETYRFGCRVRDMRALREDLDRRMPRFADHGTVFFGSGDFHHLSWPLVQRCIAAMRATSAEPLRLVVLDNHPDNMRFPWGVHCGSWVRRVALMPEVAHVHVAGITSGDIGPGHAWENYLAPLRAGKLTYWSAGVDTRWGRWLGAGSAFRSFDDLDALVHALCRALMDSRAPTYLSIDKDVFAEAVLQTNWDQGDMRLHHLDAICAALAGTVVGSDVCGEVSSWHYRTRWKRWLSAADGQAPPVPGAELAAWQQRQGEVNQRILTALSRRP